MIRKFALIGTMEDGTKVIKTMNIPTNGKTISLTRITKNAEPYLSDCVEATISVLEHRDFLNVPQNIAWLRTRNDGRKCWACYTTRLSN